MEGREGWEGRRRKEGEGGGGRREEGGGGGGRGREEGDLTLMFLLSKNSRTSSTVHSNERFPR